MRRKYRLLLRFSRGGAVPRRSATTLIELLFVIAIIAVLMTLLVPSLKRTMDLASKTICMHHLRDIHASLTMYQVENDGWLPTASHKEELVEARNSESPESPDVWFLRLFPTYMEEPMALTCPKDPFRFRMADARNHLAAEPDVADYSSYGINSLIAQGAGGKLADLDRNYPSRPADTILVADLGPDREYTPLPVPAARARRLPSSKGPEGPSRNDSLLSWDDGFDPLKPQVGTWLTTRHGDGINMLTVGGSVREAKSFDVLREPIRVYYKACFGGQCALCRREFGEWRYHYSFAKDRLYWWTGKVPSE